MRFFINDKKAFTLAEVLITLGIIGIVAAMTIPVLIANTRSSQYRSRFKKTVSTLSQAARLSESLYGFDYAGITQQCGSKPAEEHPDSVMSVCAIFNGTLTGLTYYNTATDKFFKTQTFEKLQRIGFFKDLEQNRDKTKVNEHGFVTGNCAELDGECQGLNRVNIITSVRYNRYFFSYDPKTGEWTNLFTGKDEDLLGFDHNGNRVNPNCDMEFDQYGFNKDGIHIDTHCMYNKEGMCREKIKVSERPEGYFPIRDILMGEYLPDVPEPRRSFEIEKKLIEWIVLFNSYSPIKRSEWYKAVIIENYEKKFGKNLSKEVLYRCKEYQESMAIINEEFIEISQDLDDEIRENDSKIERKKDEKQNAKSKRGKRNSEVSKKPQTNQASTDDESPGDDR